MTRRISSWKELGSRGAEARKIAQLSQADLATAVRLDRTAITKVESGERKLDSLELTRIANVLKLPIEWFLTPPLPAVGSRRASRDPTDESKAEALLERLAQDVKLVIDLRLLYPPALPKPMSIAPLERAEASACDLRRQLELPPGPIWELWAAAGRVG